MKYLRGFDKFREYRGEKVNEEIFGIFGALKELFGKIWDAAASNMKKALGDDPDSDKIKGYLDQNILDPTKNTFIFKQLIEDFKNKKQPNDEEFNKNPDKSCLEFIGKILDPTDGALGSGPKGSLQQLYDDLLRNFGKEAPTVDIVKYYFETIRNRAIKDYRYAKGPDLKVGKPVVINPKDISMKLTDLTHLPDLKKILTNAKDKRQATLDWVNKNLLVRLDRYLSEIKNEEVDKYIESVGKSGSDDYKEGDSVMYKRDNWDKNKAQDVWNKLTADEKKKPNEGKLKELIDNGSIGVKVIKKVEKDFVRFADVDWVKNNDQILGKLEAKTESQDELVNTLKDVKTKNPEGINDLNDIAKLYEDPVANKAKIDAIKSQLGSK
jgi:hypothetical protein